MKRFHMACAVLAMVGATHATALAAPVQIDFNVAGFGPTPGDSSTFTKTGVVGDVDLTFEALDAQLQSAGLLYWDANDGNGFRDGFGIMGSGYSSDEIEENERLRLTFSHAVNLLGFNLTDFFHEEEPSDLNCIGGMEHCYVERGYFQLAFGDGTSSGWTEFNAYDDAVRTGNGLYDFALNADNVVGIVFRAPGASPNAYGNGYKKLEDFSLAGIRIDTTVPVPEPGTLALLGLGLSGLVARRRRRA